MSKIKKPDDDVLEYIKENYFYDGNGGVNSKQKDNVGWLDTLSRGRSHYKIEILNRKYRRSHIVWFLCNNKWPELEIDHKNRDATDDKIDNLRDVTHDINQQNKNNYKGYRGFSISKELNSEDSVKVKHQLYRVRNQRRGIYLNRYYTREEAMAAIDKYWDERGMSSGTWNFEKS